MIPANTAMSQPLPRLNQLPHHQRYLRHQSLALKMRSCRWNLDRMSVQARCHSHKYRTPSSSEGPKHPEPCYRRSCNTVCDTENKLSFWKGVLHASNFKDRDPQVHLNLNHLRKQNTYLTRRHVIAISEHRTHLTSSPQQRTLTQTPCSTVPQSPIRRWKRSRV